MIYTVSAELYAQVAELLLERIGSKSYFSGVVELSTADGVECRLVTSCVIYRRRIIMPEGEAQPIYSVVPVWWEFHAFTPATEICNDFSFRELGLESMC